MKEFAYVLQDFESSFELKGLIGVLIFWMLLMALFYALTGSLILGVVLSGAFRVALIWSLAVYKLLDNAAYTLIKNHYSNHEGEVKHVQFFF